MPLAKKLEKKYTYRDYLKWPDDLRCEIINGEIYDMTPAPGRQHQKISMKITGQFWDYLRDKTCEIYAAPFDVRLPEGKEKDDNIQTVVQPDIVIICDKKKLDDKGCIGAPDLIVEIISPSTASKDLKIKLQLYEKHGVKEYWLVHPEEKTVMVFKQGRKREYKKPDVYSNDDKIKVGVLKGLVIDLGEVFKA
jgi:Uma2 family endonuclease